VRHNRQACRDFVKHLIYNSCVRPKRLSNFRLEDELLEGLSLVKERDGIPLTEPRLPTHSTTPDSEATASPAALSFSISGAGAQQSPYEG
jgi:hypothetical protein